MNTEIFPLNRFILLQIVFVIETLYESNNFSLLKIFQTFQCLIPQKRLSIDKFELTYFW